MTVPHIIGADLSKKSIDFASYQSGQHVKFHNNREGFKELINWIKRLQVNTDKILIVMEHTGLYSYLFEQFLLQQQISYTKVSALAIKRSMGLVRGKTDKKDAYRIAQYGFEKLHQLTPLKTGQPWQQQLRNTSKAVGSKKRTWLLLPSCRSLQPWIDKLVD
jgi:transposase